ncbi:hypothetical protein [Cyanobium gracile]|uniref:Uncharacterized protein n=1 Tax=Cyanobium gracile (strain ATCC 27147 / PCC 6307) TaxID=292564 RepID=K9P5F4_CYAGP|nr:hypothetical protein [Cyanobium gracile]AFY27931.1 hypothetical protein Cyagr_0744 [Cyanobium gracile PCC 6307]
MIWRELIEDEVPANPLVSLLAFLLFSGLCLLVSLQGGVGYVIGLLLFLLPMEWLMARLGYGAPLQRRVQLQSWGDRLRLFADMPEGSERLELGRAAVTAVLIRQASVLLAPLGERSLGWDLVLAVADPVGEHLLARAAGFSGAWQRGHALAADLGVPLRLAGDLDTRQLVGSRPGGPQPDNVWRLETGAASTRLIRSRRGVGAAQWWRSFAEQGRDLLFVAVLNTVMVKYGGFLVWMFGPRLGLSAPTTLVLDLSLPGLLSLGLPEWTVIQTLLVIAALGAAGIGSYRQWSPQELSVADDQIHLRRPGQPSRQLPLRMITAVLRLPGPDPRAILWSERRPPIVVDGLSGEREAAELLEKLEAVLDQSRG